MATDKQIEANRQNAKKSTGPKNKTSKARVSKNAIKHGLLATEIVLPSENKQEFDDLSQELTFSLNPEGAIENILVRRIAAITWRLQRIQRIETGLMAKQRYAQQHEDARECMNLVDELNERNEKREKQKRQSEQTQNVESPVQFETNTPEQPNESTVADVMQEKAMLGWLEAIQNENSELPKLATDFSKIAEFVPLLHRYETSLEKSLYKALHELQRLQAARKGQQVSLPVAVDVHGDVGNSLSE